MDYNNIRTLLEKYWEGETSLEEEDEIKLFFHTHTANLPSDLLEAAPLFQYFEEAVPTTTLPTMEELTAAFTNQASTKQNTPVIKMRFLRHWMQYAAMLLVVFGIGWGIRQHIQKDREDRTLSFRQDSFDNPKEAYAETQKALQLLARNLNKGKHEVAKMSYINEATEKVKAD